MKYGEFVLVANCQRLLETVIGIKADTIGLPSIKKEDLESEEIAWSYIRRKEAREDPTYRQLIPYVIFRQSGNILAYQRTSMNGEERMIGSSSIGFGGHIDLDDAALREDGYLNISETVRSAMLRELKEELNFSDLPLISNAELKGGIANSDNNVNATHFALVYIIDLPESHIMNLKLVENSILIKDSPWVSLEDLRDNINEYEPWSKTVIEALYSEK